MHHSYLDGVIQKHTVHCFSYCVHSTEWEGEVRETTTDSRTRKGLLKQQKYIRITVSTDLCNTIFTNILNFLTNSLLYSYNNHAKRLSKDVKNAKSIHSFKKKIRKVDIQHIITEGYKKMLFVFKLTDIFETVRTF